MDTGNPLPVARAKNASTEAQVRLSQLEKKQNKAVSETTLEGIQEATKEIRAKEQGVGGAVNVEA